MANALEYGVFRKRLLLAGTETGGVTTGVSLSTSASVTNGATHEIPNATRLSAFWVNVSAIAGDSATATVKLQHSPDGGGTWLDTGLTTAALAATGAVKVAITCDLFATVRVVATLSATTTPTATYTAWMGYSSETGSLPARQ